MKTAFKSVPPRYRLTAVLGAVFLALFAACWWFTEPLGSPARPAVLETRAVTSPPSRLTTITTFKGDSPPDPTWPTSRLEGNGAKRLLLSLLESARRRLDRVQGYTATFRRQERIGGKLGPEQTLRLKSRPEPFAIYLKFVAPHPGKEVVFAKGRHDDKLVAHNGDWKDRLIPRLKLDPAGALALADSRHPITEAGLVNLTDRLIRFRRMDLADTDAVTVLDRVADPDGKARPRSIHTHTVRKPDRPFARVEVHYDPETFLPVRIASYDWPAPGEDPVPPQLAERYSYDDLNLDARLTDLDFDPANPAYAFSRF